MFDKIEKAHITTVIVGIEIPAIAKFKSENLELWNNAVPARYNLLVTHTEIKDIIIQNNYFDIKI